jgi:hypothetical protein
MRALEKRLRRLEVVTLPQPETEDSRRLQERLDDLRRRRAERLGIPVAEEVPEPGWRGMTLAEIIRGGRRNRELT